MKNYRWKYARLQPADLPKKAQRFIEMMDIDTSHLTLMSLISCPNGEFNKSFKNPEEGNPIGKFAAIAEFDAVYFFSDCMKVGINFH